MGLKYNTRENVLKSTSGGVKLALCYELGLIHETDDLTKIHGFYSEMKRGWIIRERGYYSTGGWGAGSSGDRDGHYIQSNALELLQTIEAKVYVTNAPNVSDLSQIEQMQKRTDKIILLKKNAKKLGLNPDLSDFEETGLKIKPYGGRYDSEKTSGLNSGRGFNPEETVKKYDEAMNVFLNAKGKKTKVDVYTIEANVIKSGNTLVAFRTKDKKIILNSQRLQCSRFETKVLGGQSIIQKKIREIADLSIPLNVLESAKLKLSETRVIEQGPQEEFNTNSGPQHFTGSLLLENNGRKFLMDLDRREIQHGIWNPFFCEVNKKSKSVVEAYDSMMPDEVKQAIKDGIETERQGEWFFINTGKTLKVTEDEIFMWASKDDLYKFGVMASKISHGKGRPNSLYIVQNSKDTTLNGLACGIVSHSGREHKDLCLGGVYNYVAEEFSGAAPRIESQDFSKDASMGISDFESLELKLWRVVANTTVSNFTIEGNVD